MTALQKLASQVQNKSNSTMRQCVTKHMTALEKLDLQARARQLALVPKR